MRRVFRAILAAGILVPTVGTAQQSHGGHKLSASPPPVVALKVEEPVTVFGVPLGQPFTVAQCAEEQPITVTANCFTYEFPNLDDSFRILHFVDPPVLGREITANVKGGEVAFFTITTSGIRSQDYTLAQLTEKFGKPTKLDRVPEQNLMGAKFIAIRAVWDIPQCYVQFDADSSDGGSHEGKMDEGWISISTRKHHEEEHARLLKNMKAHTPL